MALKYLHNQESGSSKKKKTERLTSAERRTAEKTSLITDMSIVVE